MKQNQPHPLLVQFIQSLAPLDETDARDMAKHLQCIQFHSGDCLIAQGESTDVCFFILKGLVRQFALDERGIETTYGFLSERQSVVASYVNDQVKPSPYSFFCLEDTIAIVGSNETSKSVFLSCPQLFDLSRNVLYETMDQFQDTLQYYIRLSPEARVKHLYETRSDLFTRVPQHQLASYLNITPESLSRIKKRLKLTFNHKV